MPSGGLSQSLPPTYCADIKKAGLWRDFQRIVQKYKRQGVEPEKALILARLEFEEVRSDIGRRLDGIGGPAATAEHNLTPPWLARKQKESDFAAGPRSLATPRKTVSGEVFSGKESTARRVVEWVFENLYVKDVKPEDAPSAGAWGYLQAILADPTREMERRFLTSVWPQLIPSKSLLDAEEGRKNEAGNVLDLIEKCTAALTPADQPLPAPGAEGAESQP